MPGRRACAAFGSHCVSLLDRHTGFGRPDESDNLFFGESDTEPRKKPSPEHHRISRNRPTGGGMSPGNVKHEHRNVQSPALVADDLLFKPENTFAWPVFDGFEVGMRLACGKPGVKATLSLACQKSFIWQVEFLLLFTVFCRTGRQYFSFNERLRIFFKTFLTTRRAKYQSTALVVGA